MEIVAIQLAADGEIFGRVESFHHGGINPIQIENWNFPGRGAASVRLFNIPTYYVCRALSPMEHSSSAKTMGFKIEVV